MISQLSIIIPTLNEEHYLPSLLESIAKQKYEGKLQVIVVDGASKDRTVAVAKKFESRIKDLSIIQVKRGTAYQRNRGAEKAKYAYLLFLDADIVLPTNFLTDLTKKAQPKGDFVDFALHVPIKPDFFDYCFIAFMFSIAYVMQFFDPANSGSFIFTTKNLHKKIRGFNEDAVFGEDIDYMKRGLQAGATYHLWFFPYVLASPRRLRKEGRMRLIYLYFRSGLYIKRHGPIRDPKLFPYVFGEHRKY
jgi:glycosyltransferase involved in cell wall biosynthesis